MDVLRNLLRLAMILVMLLGLASDRGTTRTGDSGDDAGQPALEIVVRDRDVGDGLRIRLHGGESDYVVDITRQDGKPVRVDAESGGAALATVE